MALHLPIGPLKTCSGLVNLVPTCEFAADIATAPLGPDS